MKKISLDLAEKRAFNPSPSPFEAVPAEMSRSGSAEMPENGYAEHSLNGSWLMSEGGDSQPDFSRAVTAQIPCTVQTALFEDGKIPDPMFGKNDKYAREAAYKIWWFKKESTFNTLPGFTMPSRAILSSKKFMWDPPYPLSRRHGEIFQIL